MQMHRQARTVVLLGVDTWAGHRVAGVQASRRKRAGGKRWGSSTDKRWPSCQWSHRDWKWIVRGSAALSSTSGSGRDLTSILPKKGKVASVREVRAREEGGSGKIGVRLEATTPLSVQDILNVKKISVSLLVSPLAVSLHFLHWYFTFASVVATLLSDWARDVRKRRNNYQYML